jgi:hypothetical protein
MELAAGAGIENPCGSGALFHVGQARGTSHNLHNVSFPIFQTGYDRRGIKMH